MSTALPLPALPIAREQEYLRVIGIEGSARILPDTVEWLHDWCDGEEVVLSLAREALDYWLRVPDYADFLLQPATCRILVSADSTQDTATLEHLLVDQVLPRFLAQQGELLVHASTVTMGYRHTLFLGPSGWGKSTLAGLLQRRGHDVLSDDCVQLNTEGTRLNAVPTYPSLRLNADSLDAVFPDLTETAPVASYSDKRRVPMSLPAGADISVPVSALYLLGDPANAGNTICITPLRPAEICLALIKHSFRLDLGDRAASARQLERCSHIARTVPAFRLDYPRDYGLHDALERAITGHLAALPALT